MLINQDSAVGCLDSTKTVWYQRNEAASIYRTKRRSDKSWSIRWIVLAPPAIQPPGCQKQKAGKIKVLCTIFQVEECTES